MNFDRVTLMGHDFSCNPLSRAVTLDEFRTMFRSDVADDDIQEAYRAVSPYALYTQYRELSNHMNRVAAERMARSAEVRQTGEETTVDVRQPVLDKQLDDETAAESSEDVRRPMMS